MDTRELKDTQKHFYNAHVNHIMQSWQWGDFRKKMGVKVLRFGVFEKGKMDDGFQLSLHKIPLINKYVGYLPKGPYPDDKLAQSLSEIGKRYNCAFIKIEPNIEVNNLLDNISPLFRISPKPLF